jgi:hypothetical protein
MMTAASLVQTMYFLTRSMAIRFQCPGGVAVPLPSAQNVAISFCSRVSERPTSYTSRISAAASEPVGSVVPALPGGGLNSRMDTVRTWISVTPPGIACARGVPRTWTKMWCILVMSSDGVVAVAGVHAPMNIWSKPSVVSRPQMGAAAPGPREFSP